MDFFDLIIKEGVCLLPDPRDPKELTEEAADIAVKDGLIRKIGSLGRAEARETIAARGLHVLPGLMDTQVHFREPGMEHKEDIAHGTAAAVKGGITAVFEMPNTLPPTMAPQDLEEKIQRASGKSHCDFAFYLGASRQNAAETHKTDDRQGCCGLKIFLGNSTGSLAVDDEETLSLIFSNRRRITALHCEDESRLSARRPLAETPPPHPRNHLLWRDAESAFIATKRAVRLARKHSIQIHVLHVSSKQEIEYLKDHKDFVSVEVTPQHLTLSAPECYERHSAFAQMNPPIRDKTHQEALWKAVSSGTVDIIGSDHAPHTREEKERPYPQSPSGMPGTQTLLPLMLNHIHQGRLDLKTLVKLTAHNPCRRFQIKGQGQIKEGWKAHFTIVDLKARRKIESSWLASKCGWSPFEGLSVTGWPVITCLYGQAAMRDGELLGPPAGRPMSFLDVSQPAAVPAG